MCRCLDILMCDRHPSQFDGTTGPYNDENLLFLTLFSLHVTTNALFAYHVGDVPVGCMSLQPQSDVNTHIRSDFKG